MNYTFNDYLEENFRDIIADAAQEMLDEDNIRGISAKVIDVSIKQIDITKLLQTDDHAEFPVIICAVIRTCEDDRVYRQNVEMKGSISGTFSELFRDFSIKLRSISCVKANSRRQKYTQTLLPEHSKNKMEQIAEEILDMAYPFLDVYHRPQRIDPIYMAKKFGIKCYFVQLGESFSIRGRYVFKGEEIKVFYPNEKMNKNVSVPANTILVDKRLNTKKEAVHFTVMHELIHAIVHRYALWLKLMYDGESCSLACPAGVFESHSFKDMFLEIMEKQADNIAAYVLMPAPAFKKKAEEILNSYGCIRTPDCIKEAADRIASFFGVSVSAARRRLIELGFDEFKGVYNFVDNKYVPPFVFRKGTLASHETFVISEEQVKLLVRENRKLRSYFSRDLVRFAENHVVLNEPEYIYRDNKGMHLTKFAREHIDCCAFKYDLLCFSLEQKNTTQNSMDTMLRMVGSTMSVQLIMSDSNTSMEEKAELLNERKKDITEISKKIGGSFPEALTAVVEWSDMKKGEIAQAAWTDEKTLYNLCHDDEIRVSMETVVRLCIAMNLPTEVSYRLLNCSGNPPKAVASDIAFIQFLDAPSLYTIGDCNKILAAQGSRTLGGKEPGI
ncbi:MAG: ImmA/IrrE family metallo-endopeptidase [Oscillospiraceae bacterium]|nr:ImmA/IrrE family metallo-endopeptidase [Oscillospiraceae bacterium]